MTSKSFDPYDWRLFYFGKMGREEAASLLQEDSIEVGTFLLRDSSREGDYSLSVRESLNVSDPKAVRHYLIQQSVDEELNRCIKIGAQCFADIPSMLNYYKMRLLENCSLTTPYKNMKVTKMIGKWRFVGETDADLSFVQGEDLEVMGDCDPGWLIARNAIGRVGRVPAEYVGEPEYETSESREVPLREMIEKSQIDLSSMQPWKRTEQKRSFPCWARASFSYTPNIYNKERISVKKRDIIFVTEIRESGWARGRVYGEGVQPQAGGEEEPKEERHEELTLDETYADPRRFFKRKDRSYVGEFPSSLLDFCADEEGIPKRQPSRFGEWREIIGSSDDDEDEREQEINNSRRLR